MTPMRRAALDCLAGERGVFLRCDRGDSLYVTNAPSRMEKSVDWAQAGFAARIDGGLAFLIPEGGWIARFNGWAQARVQEKRLSGAIGNAAFSEADGEDILLWIEGIKRLELRGNAAEYEKMVRRRAAVCLREKRGGGTLVSCALIVDMMNEGGIRDED